MPVTPWELGPSTLKNTWSRRRHTSIWSLCWTRLTLFPLGWPRNGWPFCQPSIQRSLSMLLWSILSEKAPSSPCCGNLANCIKTRNKFPSDSSVTPTWARALSSTLWGMVTTSHRHPAVFRFLACVCNASILEGFYGPHMTRIRCWSNPNVGSCWDPGPRDPRGVPWDQNFGSIFFLITSSNDVILWVLLICYCKNAEKWQKLFNFFIFDHY